jgi:RNA polymerase sigma-70 factor (ECF subfamily)
MSTKPDFNDLVEAHSGELYAYLWRLLGDEHEAQDCLQDTFLRAYRAYGRTEASHLRAWLYKIATNSARNHWARANKHSNRQTSLYDEVPARDKSVDAQVMERISLAEVKAAVDALPARQRAALLMRKYQQLEYSEIATALACTEQAARANVYQALKKLRSLFAEEE